MAAASPEVKDAASRMAMAASPSLYARYLGDTPFEWQDAVLRDLYGRIAIDGARQSGKSSIVSILPAHRARFFPKSLSLILAATEKQANLDMRKVKAYIAQDRAYPEILRSSESEIELANGSFIAVVPATEKSARGYSKPDIVILDEDSRIEDEVHVSGVIPFFTDNPDGVLYVISSPNGRSGFFAKAMESSSWSRYVVRAPWEVDDMNWKLMPFDPVPWIREMNRKGVNAYLSPRHANLEEQQRNLMDMGPLMYHQEYLAEFVEPEDQVFGNEDIKEIFRDIGIKPLFKQGVVAMPDIQPLFPERQ